MNKKWKGTVEGSDRDGQGWSVNCVVDAEFADVVNAIMEVTFRDLTSGKAIFGCPGVGCNGPYKIHRLTVEEVRQ